MSQNVEVLHSYLEISGSLQQLGCYVNCRISSHIKGLSNKIHFILIILILAHNYSSTCHTSHTYQCADVGKLLSETSSVNTGSLRYFSSMLSLLLIFFSVNIRHMKIGLRDPARVNPVLIVMGWDGFSWYCGLR